MRYVEQRYAQWVRSRLPDAVPPALAERLTDLDLYGEVRGMQLWVHTSHGPALAHTARDEEDLLLCIYGMVCHRLALAMAAESDAAERRRWRYVPVTDGAGRTAYQEQADYDYNAIWQPDKARCEIYVALAGPVLPWVDVEAHIHNAETGMNKPYPRRHWAFDRRKRAFVEISDVRERALDAHPILPPITPRKEE